MNIITIDLSEEQENLPINQSKLTPNPQPQHSIINIQELSESSKGDEQYQPQSQSSQNTLKYKRHHLRQREIQTICPDEFYSKGKYSSIHKLKIDAQIIFQQKLQSIRNNPPPIKVKQHYHKKQEFPQRSNKKKCISKADRLKIQTKMQG